MKYTSYDNRKLLLMLLFALCLITSCKNESLYNPNGTMEIVHLPIADTIIGNDINTNILCAHEIECIDSVLVVLNNQSGAYICIVDMKQDSVISQFGALGRAKNEFLDFPKIVYNDKDEGGNISLFCPDLLKSTTKVINLKESIAKGICCIEREIKHEKEGIAYRTFFINGNKSITRQDLTYDDPRDNIFYPPCFFITDGRKRIDIDTYPNVMKSDNPSLLFMAYADILKVSPDKTRLLQVFNCIDLFNVIDINNESVFGFMGEGAYSFEDIQAMTDMEVALEKMRLYNQDVCVTNDIILMLRDERPVRESESEDSSSCSILRICDWKGNPITAYRFDRQLQRIAYSEKFKVLYGLDAEGRIFKYDMKQIN